MRGFTLIEVLISIAILSIGAVLIMQALARGAYAIHMAEVKNRVYNFASARLADLDVGSTQGLIPKTGGTFTMDGQSLSWQFERTLTEQDPELEHGTLTVSWAHGDHQYAEQFPTVRRVYAEKTR